MTTTIQLSDKCWKKLNQMKERGETFEDVILLFFQLVRKLNLKEELKQIRQESKK